MKNDKSVKVLRRENGTRQVVSSDVQQVKKLERYLFNMRKDHPKRAAYYAKLKDLLKGEPA